MKALFNPKAPFDHSVFSFSDRQGEVIELNLVTQPSTQVAAIEFSKKARRIPVPCGIVIAVINPETNLMTFYAPGLNNTVWFNATYQFRVQYFGVPLYAGKGL